MSIASNHRPPAPTPLPTLATQPPFTTIQPPRRRTHTTPPALFGSKFMLIPAGNRFGLPAFYALHAWVWKHNPSGTFAQWNPQVHCPSQARASGADITDEPMMGGMHTFSDPANSDGVAP